jgi:hypothetical protein
MIPTFSVDETKGVYVHRLAEEADHSFRVTGMSMVGCRCLLGNEYHISFN